MAIEVRFGRFQLLRRIAQGGMAEVYLAQQTGPAGFSKQLVIKKIHPHLAHNEEFVGMFLDEARVAALLSHPNIGQIYELGEEHGQYYIAMEYIDGCNLRQLNKRLRRKGILMPPELAARIAADVCNALEYAHRFRDADQKLLRLVHRDISPQNVMMSRDGAVKLIDFGIAKATTNQQLTQGNVLKGKFSYMSPEQASGKRLDRRSDIFSVGVVLYEMLLGEKPFRVPGQVGKSRSDNTELLRLVTRCEYRLPGHGEVPDALVEFIKRTMTAHRGDRYQTAREARDALETALRDMPGDGSPRRLARFVSEIMNEEEIPTNSGSLPSLEASHMASSPKVMGDDDPEATAAMDLNTVAMDQPKPETASPSTLEPTRKLPSAPAPEEPIREEVSMNNDAPTRIRVSTLDAYGTQGGQTGLTRTTVQRSTLGLVVLASLIGAAAGLAMAYLI
ncbi:MAG: serine/threonine-protein kinase [Myxococcota bacterium]|nr:serine/threonine-protein kinase [Myxococcota bacterium]